MIDNRYRLNDYIITEYDNHFLTWEMNVVLGEHRTGNCFIIGDILVFHSFSLMKNGCLKLEYSEKLARLPVWPKTRYYCFSDSLKEAKNGTILSNRLDQTTVERYRHIVNRPVKKGEYRLGLYKIIVNSDEDIFWEKYDGLNKINKGSCVIMSGLLFIQSKVSSNDGMQSRREWSYKLKSLTKWEITPAWGHLKVLRNCNQNKEIKKLRPNLSNLDYMTPHSVDATPHLNRHAEKREMFFELLANTLEKTTRLWRYLFGKKDWRVRVFSRLNIVLYIIFNLVSVLLRKGVYGINKIGVYIRTRFKN
ncbi:MAG: hypothetical protein KKE62_01320 [Proteobacteria bacterium]|nr:hypothetical protein [Pseudomonadota bacterium]MBU1541459.1 hypothetical protein [Pseudomonadota bacterium]MBU2480295.1 hypothetical protein [Pseudomonadota bacterium]